MPIALPVLLPALAIATAIAVAGCAQPRAADHPDGPLHGKRVAILAADGFEQDELLKPRAALDAAGAVTVVVSPQHGTVRAWAKDAWGERVAVDVPLAGAQAGEYDALVLPGGVINPDHLRIDPAAVAFVHAFVAAGKPIAAICHGPWTLIEADGVRGHRLTSWPSLRSDLTNAGATWVDEPVVTDGRLVTSRKPADIPEFNTAAIALFGK